MPGPKDKGRSPAETGQTAAEFNADLAQSVMHKYKQGARAPGVRVVMPGGHIHDATPYLESKYRVARHSLDYGEVKKWLRDEWWADHPGFEIAWPKATDQFLASRVRDHSYVYVAATDLKDDCPLAYTETVGIRGEQAIQITDCVCVAVSPEAYDRLFKIKEAMGVAAVVGNYDTFYTGVEQEGGRGEVWTGGGQRGPERG